MPKPSKVPLHAAPPPAEAGAPSPEPKRARPAKPSRRSFTAAQKLAIVREADACTERGDVEALLRRKGLYSSHLAAWRKALRLHGEQGLVERGPGRPRTRDARDARIAELERTNARLEAELARASALLDLQKKVSAFLAIELPRSDVR
jgi:transposase-like protein